MVEQRSLKLGTLIPAVLLWGFIFIAAYYNNMDSGNTEPTAIFYTFTMIMFLLLVGNALANYLKVITNDYEGWEGKKAATAFMSIQIVGAALMSLWFIVFGRDGYKKWGSHRVTLMVIWLFISITMLFIPMAVGFNYSKPQGSIPVVK
jgi:hypothetical protein